MVRRSRLPHRRVMTDNALAYTRGRAFTTTLNTIGANPQTHPAVPSPDQRKGGTIPPDPSSWMGRQTRLPEQRRETSSTHRIHRDIQSDPTPQRTRRTITHDRPRQPPLWEGHLAPPPRSADFDKGWPIGDLQRRRKRFLQVGWVGHEDPLPPQFSANLAKSGFTSDVCHTGRRAPTCSREILASSSLLSTTSA